MMVFPRLARILMAGCGLIVGAAHSSAFATQNASTAETHVRLTLHSGEVVEGEQVAEYDHSIWWWEKELKSTRAIFDSSKFHQDHSQDRSVRFIGSERIAKVESRVVPPKGPSFRQFLRDKGIILSKAPLSGHYQILTGNDSYHLEESGKGDFAWDLVRADASGRRHGMSSSELEDYLVWDSKVRLPIGGTIVEIIREAPDLPIGTLDLEAVNNYLGIHVTGAYYFYLLHFRQNSIPERLRIGQHLKAGTYIGRVGNSGVTLEPHLHMTLFFFDQEAAQPRYWSVPIEFKNTSTSQSLAPRSFRCSSFRVPQTGEWVRGPHRTCP